MTPRGVNFDPLDPLTRALRALPEPRAPHTLAPRVMAAVHARIAHPPARTWFEWPRVWQVASLSTAVAVLAAVVVGWPFVIATLGAWLQPGLEGVMARAQEVVHAGKIGLAFAGVVFRAVWHPIVMPFVLFVTAMTIACAVIISMLGAVLSRAALGGASR
jgi:Sec-independent protein secretion pathway component TatC